MREGRGGGSEGEEDRVSEAERRREGRGGRSEGGEKRRE